MALVPEEDGVHDYYSEFSFSPEERERKPKSFEDALEILIARKTTGGLAFDKCIIALMKLAECMRRLGLHFPAKRECDYCVAELIVLCQPDPDQIFRGIRMLQERSVQCVAAAYAILDFPESYSYENSFRLFREFLDFGTSSAATSSSSDAPPYNVPVSRPTGFGTLKLVKTKSEIDEFRSAALKLVVSYDTYLECQPPTFCSEEEILCWLAPWLIPKNAVDNAYDLIREESRTRLIKSPATHTDDLLEIDDKNESNSIQSIINWHFHQIASEGRDAKKIADKYGREIEYEEKSAAAYPISKRRKKH